MEAKIIEDGRIGHYLKLYSDLKSKVSNDIAIAIIQEIGKDERCTYLRNARQENEVRADLKATPKQLEFMKKLGLKVDANISRVEASEMIDEALNR